MPVRLTNAFRDSGSNKSSISTCLLSVYGNKEKSWTICAYFAYFEGSWSFVLITVPKREKKILLCHYISSFCSLLQVAFVFSVTSYCPS